MKDYVSFPVYDGNEINENIEKLQNLLEQTGIEIHYVKTNDSLFEKLNLAAKENEEKCRKEIQTQ